MSAGIQVIFTPDELKFVHQLVDLSLKTYGTNALGPAYILTMKLQMAEQRAGQSSEPVQAPTIPQIPAPKVTFSMEKSPAYNSPDQGREQD